MLASGLGPGQALGWNVMSFRHVNGKVEYVLQYMVQTTRDARKRYSGGMLLLLEK